MKLEKEAKKLKHLENFNNFMNESLLDKIEGPKYEEILASIRSKDVIEYNDLKIAYDFYRNGIISEQELKNIKKKNLTYQLIKLSGIENPTGLEQTIPHSTNFPLYNYFKAKQIMKKIYNGKIPSWW